MLIENNFKFCETRSTTSAQYGSATMVPSFFLSSIDDNIVNLSDRDGEE